MYAESELLPLSALQHMAYCPRQCALIHLERAWDENVYTAEGRALHERAHKADTSYRGGVRIETGLLLRSRVLGVCGQADAVEFHGKGRQARPFPVEYKRGRTKSHDADRIQLCAQAMCLEEMLRVVVPDGALFYAAPRKREEVSFTDELRAKTVAAAESLHAMVQEGKTPAPEY